MPSWPRETLGDGDGDADCAAGDGEASGLAPEGAEAATGLVGEGDAAMDDGRGGTDAGTTHTRGEGLAEGPGWAGSGEAVDGAGADVDCAGPEGAGGAVILPRSLTTKAETAGSAAVEANTPEPCVPTALGDGDTSWLPTATTTTAVAAAATIRQAGLYWGTGAACDERGRANLGSYEERP